ncbi:MAG: fused MFS/spermidine synthase [Armatimonadota bacterium]
MSSVRSGRHRHRGALLAMATASGAAALIYQVVWMRRLVLVFGSTTLATSTALVAFLGGLAIGAWLWGRVADRHAPWSVGVFGLVEAATGAYGLLSMVLLTGIQAVYVRLSPVLEGASGAAVGAQVFLSAAVIMPAAILMGGTVPLLVREVGRGHESPSRPTGALYGWNTVGAAAGAALATYGLLPTIGLRGAVILAAVVNLSIGAAALLLDASDRRRSGRTPHRDHTVGRSGGVASESEADPARLLLVLQALGCSGLAAMAYEVAWARVLGLMMGSSVYAFGALVVVLLAGLGIGSALYGRWRRDPDGHVTAFGIIELLIAITAVLSVIIVPTLPELVVRLHPLVRDSFSLQILEHLGIAGALAFVPALLFGATFPAVVGSLGGSERLGRTIGRVYGANTVGTVLGAYLVGFVLIPSVGLRATIIVGVMANLLAAVIGLGLARSVRAGSVSRVRRVALPLAVSAVVIALVVTPAWRRESLVAGGALAAAHQGSVAGLRAEAAARRLLFYQDGVSATLSVEQAGAHRVLRINGRTNASTLPADMLVQVLPGHVPMLWHRAPRRVFIVGLGSGITAGAVARHPVDVLDIAELEPSGPRAARLFDLENRRVLSDRRVRVFPVDARARLQATPDRYDVIISIPSHLWVAGTAVLYTREFYQTARARLDTDGMFVQWVQKAGLAPQSFRLIVATFQRSFPHTSVWSAGPTHALLLGSPSAQRWDLERVQSRMSAIPGVADDLRAIGIWHPLALFAAFVLGEEDTGRFTMGVGRTLSDDWPVIEFSAPRTIFDDTAPAISAALEAVRRGLLPPMDGFDAQRRIDARASYLLGFGYASLGRAALAIDAMEAAVRASPDVAAHHVGLANQYLRAGRRREALASYQAAVRVDPRQSEALLALGAMQAEDGAGDAALDYYRRAVDAAPDFVEARVALAKALLGRGETSAALAHLIPAASRHPRHAPLHRVLADAWLASDRPDLAAEALVRAATLAPDAATYAVLAGALLRAGRAGDALDAARRALALDPFLPAALDVAERARAALRQSQ